MKDTQQFIGMVTELYAGTGAHDVLRIQLNIQETPPKKPARQQQQRRKAKAKPKSMLLPFAKAFVPEVDVQAKRIEITPPPGLLDLAIAPPGSDENADMLPDNIEDASSRTDQ